MSVGIAPPAWNDDWKHVGDKTEPPETKDDERTCGTCYHWERCPCGCAWGACEVDSELRRDDFSCDEWEEA